MLSKKGTALVTALLLVTLLLILGGTRLFFVQQSYLVAVKQDLDAEAYYLALSGLYYYQLNRWTFNQSQGGGDMEPQAVPDQDLTHFFQLTMVCPCSPLGPMGITSRGYILNSSKKVVAEKVLQIQNGFLGTMYEIK